MVLSDPLYALRPRAIWRFIAEQKLSFKLVLVYVFFEYVRPQQIYPALEIIPWSKIIIPLGLTCFLLEGRSIRWGLTELLLAVFTVIVVLSSVTAVYPEDSFNYISVYFQWVVIYLLLANSVTTERRFLAFLVLYLLWSFKMARSASWSWAMDGFAFRNWGAAGAPGWFENSGELGIQMCIYLALLVGMMNGLRRHWSRWTRLMVWGAAGMGAVAIAATSSRGSELAGICVLLWLIIKSRHRARGLVAACVLASVLALVLPPEQIERMRASGTDGTSLARKTYWAEGSTIISEHPVLGIGFNNWARYHKDHYGFIALPHNIFIEAASQLGYPGVLTFIALAVCNFVMNWQTRRLLREKGEDGLFIREMAHALDASLIAFLVAGYFVTVLFYPYFWINLAMSMALHRAAQALGEVPRAPRTALPLPARPRKMRRAGLLSLAASRR